jgi:hypothetical protein
MCFEPEEAEAVQILNQGGAFMKLTATQKNTRASKVVQLPKAPKVLRRR